MSPELLTEYCACGAEMEGSVSPGQPAANMLKRIFWSLHIGKEHGQVARPETLSARERWDRDPSMFDTEQHKK